MTEPLPEDIKLVGPEDDDRSVVSISIRKDGAWHRVEEFAKPISVREARKIGEEHHRRMFK